MIEKNLEWEINFSINDFSNSIMEIGLFPMMDMLKKELVRKRGRDLTEQEKEDMAKLWSETKL
jgi:hypothetical protein